MEVVSGKFNALIPNSAAKEGDQIKQAKKGSPSLPRWSTFKVQQGNLLLKRRLTDSPQVCTPSSDSKFSPHTVTGGDSKKY